MQKIKCVAPDTIFRIELDTGREPAPAFSYRCLNGREMKALTALQDKVAEDVDVIYTLAKAGLIKWEHCIDPATGQAVPFNVDNIDLVIDPPTAVTLVQARLDALMGEAVTSGN